MKTVYIIAITIAVIAAGAFLFRLGYEVAVIQTVLRHQSPNTTEKYLRRIGLERVRDALEDIAKAEDAEVIPISEMAKKRSGSVI